MAKKKNAEGTMKKLTFEQCLEQLQDVVHALEDGNTGLSESIAEYERGVAYLKRCHELLESAEQRIQLLSGFDADGNPISERFDETPMTLEEKAERRSRRRTRKPGSAVESTVVDNGDVDDTATLF